MKQLPLGILGLFILLSSCNPSPKVPSLKQDAYSSQIITRTIKSKFLTEDRKLTIYLPNDIEKKDKIPVVYATDGQIFLDDYKDDLDSLIRNRVTPKFVFVGVHSNEKRIEGFDLQYRNYEYIKDYADTDNQNLQDLFSNHLSFFSKELIPYIESRYPVSKDASKRIFYGASNGAGFGVSMSTEFPLLIKHYICFSMAGGNYDLLNWNKASYPNFILSYGVKEPFPLTLQIDEFHNFLQENNYDHIFYKYEGGHSRENWKSEFMKQIPALLK